MEVFLTESKNSAHLNHDEYPDSETGVLDLMVRRSGAFSSSLIQRGGRNSTRIFSRRQGHGRGYNFAQSGKGNLRPPPGTTLVAGTDGRTCNV